MLIIGEWLLYVNGLSTALLKNDYVIYYERKAKMLNSTDIKLVVINQCLVTSWTFRPARLISYKDYVRGAKITNARIRAKYAAPRGARVPVEYLDSGRRIVRL